MNSTNNISFDTLLLHFMGKLSTTEAEKVERALVDSSDLREMADDITNYVIKEQGSYEDLIERKKESEGAFNEVLYRHYEKNKVIESDPTNTGVNILQILNGLKDDPLIKPLYSELHHAVSMNLAAVVAIQGLEGSFHEIAATEFFGSSLSTLKCESFPKLILELENGNANYGIMAIENSVAGPIVPNYALLRASNFEIVGEIYLRIQHNLMTLPGQELSDIREVRSHPMALLQCQKFFQDVHPNVKMVEQDDTAGSAKWITDTCTNGVAAIASKQAARIYGLDIIAPSIETNKLNFTRFLVLMEKTRAENYPRVRNKSSICLKVPNKIGNLADILMVFKSQALNLTQIQSSPILGQPWQYFLHLDIEFDNYANYQNALDRVSSQVDDYKIMGEYERSNKQFKDVSDYNQDFELKDRSTLPGII